MKRAYVKPDIVSESLEMLSFAGPTCTCSGTEKSNFIIEAVNNWVSVPL
jgi:hypothetical protein